MNYSQKPGSPEETALAHYGVRGMKWGVRSGGLSSRLQGATQDRAQQREMILRRQNSGHSKGLDEKLGRGINIVANGGKKRMVEKNDVEIKRMQERQKRISKGEATVRDMMSGLMTTPVFDLVVSRRDNKGS